MKETWVELHRGTVQCVQWECLFQLGNTCMSPSSTSTKLFFSSDSRVPRKCSVARTGACGQSEYNICVPCDPQFTCRSQRWDVYLDSGVLPPEYAAVRCRGYVYNSPQHTIEVGRTDVTNRALHWSLTKPVRP